MARAQDGGVQTGGGINPYVVGSMQQGKQQAENRLLAAMGERGAMQRAQLAEQGAGERAQLQAQTQRAVSAAQIEAQDRRAAEAEKGRREEMEWRGTQNELSRRLEKELADNRLEWEKALHTEDVERMESMDKRAMDLARLNTMLKMQDRANNQKYMMASIDMIGRKMEADEKMKTVSIQNADKAEQRQVMYDTSKARMQEKLSADTRLDFHMAKPIATINTSIQDGLSNSGSDITVDDLTSPGLTKLKAKAMEGKLTDEDFRAAWGVFDAHAEYFEDKANAAKSDTERKYWLVAKSQALNYKTKIRQFDNDSTQYQTGSPKTFGMLIRDGLGDLEGYSEGSMYRTIRDNGLSWDDYKKDIMKAREPYLIPDIKMETPEMQKLVDELRTWIDDKRMKVEVQ